MSSYSEVPFFRILPAFLAGILYSFFLETDIYLFVIILINGLILFRYSLKYFKSNYRYRILSGISIQILYFVAGYSISEIKDDRNYDCYFSNCKPVAYSVVLSETPQLKGNKLRVIASLQSVYFNNKWISARGKYYIYFESDSSSHALQYNDRVCFENLPALIEEPKNPGEFNFKRFASLKRIYHQVFLGTNEWKFVSHGPHDLVYFSIKCRDRFLNIFQSAGIYGQQYAVLSALVLGYEDDIDKSIMRAFSASGTLHVLSVSGMHVGLIFTALSAMLAFMTRTKSLRIARIIILILFLWLYALLTGFSSSVIRSAMMFTFIIIGQSIKRKGNIYNSLSMSAFFIFILFDPLMLLEIGLQLSFLAVAGIAFIYPKIYSFLSVKNKYADHVWSLIAVSLAAQATTFPLSIFYFHQFPHYFILANLIIIPLSTIIIFSGIILLFISPFKWLLLKAGWLVNIFVIWLNNSALLFQNLPGSQMKNISVSFADCILLYLILLLIVYYLVRKRMILFYYAMILIALLLTSFLVHDYQLSKTNNVVVFSGTKNFVCQINSAQQSWLFYYQPDSAKAFMLSDAYLNYSGIPERNRQLISLDKASSVLSNDMFIDSNIIYFNHKIIRYHLPKKNPSAEDLFHPDFQYVQNNRDNVNYESNNKTIYLLKNRKGIEAGSANKEINHNSKDLSTSAVIIEL